MTEEMRNIYDNHTEIIGNVDDEKAQEIESIVPKPVRVVGSILEGIQVHIDQLPQELASYVTAV